MNNNNVKKNMNWANILVNIRGFFGGTAVQPISARLHVSKMATSSTISYSAAQFFRARSISNFLRYKLTILNT